MKSIGYDEFEANDDEDPDEHDFELKVDEDQNQHERKSRSDECDVGF